MRIMLRKSVAEGALYKLLDNYKPYSGKGEGGGEPFALKVERGVRHDGVDMDRLRAAFNVRKSVARQILRQEHPHASTH